MTSQTPPEIRESAARVTTERTTINDQTKQRYDKVYADYVDFCTSKKCPVTSDSSIKAFAVSLVENGNLKAATVKQRISGLKSTFGSKHSAKVDFNPVFKWLDGQIARESSRKAEAFTLEDIEKFIKGAPENDYILHKQILLIGVQTGFRISDLYNFEFENFVEQPAGYILKRVGTNKTDKKGIGQDHVVEKPIEWMDASVSCFRTWN